MPFLRRELRVLSVPAHSGALKMVAMNRPARIATLLLVLGAIAGVAFFILRKPKVALSDEPPKIDLVAVARGFDQPTDVQFVPGNDPRLAIVLEKTGKARVGRVAVPGETPSSDFATLFERKVRTSSELGLLGLAFHPKFATNGLVYVNYDPEDGAMRTRISELRLTLGKNMPDGASDERVLFEVDQPYVNHDGGQLAFGPDGLLYIGLGDGGSHGDPRGNGQRLDTLLGKILRIDVDRRDDGLAYGIPKDNPFVGKAGARGEIFAYGLRNPWRFTFDPQGRLIVADVGQDAWEEIDLVHAGDNLGWNVREGRHCFSPLVGCATQGLVDPIYEYGHDVGHSITGGVVPTVGALAGRYLFADFVVGRFFALDLGSHSVQPLGKLDLRPSTFGRDAAGNAYVADFVRGVINAVVAR